MFQPHCTIDQEQHHLIMPGFVTGLDIDAVITDIMIAPGLVIRSQ